MTITDRPVTDKLALLKQAKALEKKIGLDKCHKYSINKISNIGTDKSDNSTTIDRHYRSMAYLQVSVPD